MRHNRGTAAETSDVPLAGAGRDRRNGSIEEKRAMQLTTDETLERLSHMQRECFRLAVLEGRSHATVASRYRIEPVTVRTHVHRARLRLQAMPDLPARLRLAIRRQPQEQETCNHDNEASDPRGDHRATELPASHGPAATRQADPAGHEDRTR
jgi:DNA-binding NarL/FixJ family response regulator